MSQQSNKSLWVIGFIVLAIVAFFGYSMSQQQNSENVTASSESFERAGEAASAAAENAGEAAKQAAEGVGQKLNELAPAAGGEQPAQAPAQQ